MRIKGINNSCDMLLMFLKINTDTHFVLFQFIYSTIRGIEKLPLLFVFWHNYVTFSIIIGNSILQEIGN